MRLCIYLLSLLYVISPYDIVPDFLIGVGWIDDLIVLGLLWWYHYIYKKKNPGLQGNSEFYKKSGDENQAGANWDYKKDREPKNNYSRMDPYKVLGLSRNASLEEIKTAYKSLANKYHPDKVVHLGEEFRALAENKFKEIQAAYQDLTNR